MRSNRRAGGKQATKPKPCILPHDDSNRLGCSQGDEGSSPQPFKMIHIAMPPIPKDGEFLFELTILLYTAMALGLQFLNLYKTVFWLPHSYTKYAMNFYLIDPYLVAFILIVLGRRLLWYCCKLLVQKLCPSTIYVYVLETFWLFTISSVFLALLFCIYHIMQSNGWVNIFYLLYPICVYIFLFWTTIFPFFDMLPYVPIGQGAGKKPLVLGTHKLQHVCPTTANGVRNEVELLKTDFNNRMKQALFNSVISAYYTSFIPCCFAQRFLHYDIYWVMQHLGFVWLSCFTMYIVHVYPPHYCHMLHCAAVHLGHWQRIDLHNNLLPCTPWSEAVIWKFGVTVKHMKIVYRADSATNAAEPGNSSQSRFYTVFSNPSLLLCTLLGLQFSMVLLQMVLLFMSSEWHKILSLSLLVMANYYTLFKLVRDYFVMWKTYKDEQSFQRVIAQNTTENDNDDK